MAVLHIPSHGVTINGVLYSPPGGGRHPTVVVCHGLHMEALAGVTAACMAEELMANAKVFQLPGAAPGLVKMPLLALTSDDGLAPATDALVSAIKALGGTKVTAIDVATDHGWSDRRIALQSAVLTWLARLP